MIYVIIFSIYRILRTSYGEFYVLCTILILHVGRIRRLHTHHARARAGPNAHQQLAHASAQLEGAARRVRAWLQRHAVNAGAVTTVYTCSQRLPAPCGWLPPLVVSVLAAAVGKRWIRARSDSMKRS